MNHLIETLQQQNLLWHGGMKDSHISRTASGYQEVDQYLSGGFPEQGVIEVQSDFGIGELRVLLPSLLACHQKDKLWVFINPPGVVNGQMLAGEGVAVERVIVVNTYDQSQGLWASEQCLKSGVCHTVLQWTSDALAPHHIKRLQMAGNKGNARQFLFRRKKMESLPLPVDLSVSLTADDLGISAKVNKRKHGWPTEYFTINMQKQWPLLIAKTYHENVITFPNRQTG